MDPAEPITLPVPIVVCLISAGMFLFGLATWPPLGRTISLLGQIAWLYVITGARG